LEGILQPISMMSAVKSCTINKPGQPINRSKRAPEEETMGIKQQEAGWPTKQWGAKQTD
jgi:hypothetical protein